MKYNLNKIAEMLEKVEDKPPGPDIAICSECHWRGPADECEQDEDGDWETGYYTIDMCPKCEDGGCIDDYDFSPEQLTKYEEWYRANPVQTLEEYLEKRTKTMEKIDAKTVKILREQTGLGMMDCKKALEETDGDLEKAKTLLMERGAPGRTSGRKTASLFLKQPGKTVLV